MRKEIRDEIVPVSDIIPYPKNTVTHSDFQVNNIVGLIKSFGFTNPILIDEDNVVIAGHGRLKAAQKMGLEKVPCRRFIGYSENEIGAYRLLDNRITERGREWDTEMLELELNEIDLGEFDLSLDDLDFESLLTGDDDNSFSEDEDEISNIDDDGISYTNQFSVVVICKDEDHQSVVYESLKNEGYDCKVLVV